jgi:GR25 family glycosyltransferase involved in LPS biosynthesis
MKLELSKRNTFCVALDSRWPAMEQRLQRLGIPCVRWKACLPDQTAEFFAKHLNPLQKACAQSHTTLWRELIRLRLDYAFILEDDVLFHRDWRAMLDDWQVNDPDWHLILLNASERVEPEETWVKASHQWLTGGYIISKKGAIWLLSYFKEKYEADCMTWVLQDQGHSYVRFPWLIVQEGKDSTIGSDFEANRSKVLELLGAERLALYS